jgi:hypothetical protein
MSHNFATRYGARRAAVRFRRAYDQSRVYIYRLRKAFLLGSGVQVWHVEVWSSQGAFLTLV